RSGERRGLIGRWSVLLRPILPRLIGDEVRPHLHGGQRHPVRSRTRSSREGCLRRARERAQQERERRERRASPPVRAHGNLRPTLRSAPPAVPVTAAETGRSGGQLATSAAMSQIAAPATRKPTPPTFSVYASPSFASRSGPGGTVFSASSWIWP